MAADHSRTSLPLTHAAASDSAAREAQAQTLSQGLQPQSTGEQTSTRGPSTRGTTRGAARGAGRGRGRGRGQAPTPKSDLERRKEDPRHRAIALHHAHRIQAQKDTEALILDHILNLSEAFPSSHTTDPAHPAPSDVQTFKSALTPFQPADYDNLIQERNIEGRCGYALCPRDHRKDNETAGGRGSFRIRYGAPGSGPGGRGREMNIVPKEKLEMWCSDACAERALYIRVQLAQEPVWERRGEATKELVLLEEGRTRPSSSTSGPSSSLGQVTQQLGELSVQGTDRVTDTDMQTQTRHAQLALERGERGAVPFGRVDVHVRENQDSGTPAMPPQFRPEDAQGGSIEGYVPNPNSRPE